MAPTTTRSRPARLLLAAACAALLLTSALGVSETVDLYPSGVQVKSFVPPEGLNSTAAPDLSLTAVVGEGEDISIRCQPRSTNDRTTYPWVSSMPSGGTERLYISAAHPAFGDYPEDAGQVLCQLVNEGQPPREATIDLQHEWRPQGAPAADADEAFALEQVLQACCDKAGSCVPWRSMKAQAQGPGAVNHCTLPGMICNDDGHFVSLDFNGYNLTCELPTSGLVSFRELRSLVLAQGHDLQGDVEKALFGLSSLDNLEVLQLSNSPGLGGMLSAERQLGPLCSLAKASLKVLDMRNLSASGSLPDCLLGAGSKLQFVHLGWNNLTGEIPDVITRHSALTWLTVNDNSLEGRVPPSLGKAQHLYMINVTSNALSGSLPSELGNIAYLMHILARNNGLNGSIPNAVATHPRLITLDLRNNKLTGLPSVWSDTTPGNLDILRQLNLQAVRLANNSLGGDVPPGLLVMRDLLELNLAVNDFSGKLPANLLPGTRTNFPNMLIFNISGNQISGSVPEVYGEDMRMFLQSTSEVPGRGGVLNNWTFTFDVSRNKLEGKLPAFLNSSNLKPGQDTWINANLTEAGKLGNGCEPPFSWVTGACPPSGTPLQDDSAASAAGSEVERADAAVAATQGGDKSEEEGQAVASASDEAAADEGDGSGGLSGGAIAGIVVGSVAGAALLALLALLLAKKRSGSTSSMLKGLPSLPSIGGGGAASNGKFTKFDDSLPVTATAGGGAAAVAVDAGGARAAYEEAVVPSA